ncbi:hypothetical protein CPT_Stahl80 [Bacillus phage Stahl]|uniref:Uncharacterized protein n=1 Tax=Bacillus phage Stahl TaxID=1610832 RepID=A0A0E3JQ75_9CAUD|nr:hypothetical protein CPT_Stahl80 [Bacillus phage Stahl]AKA61508.1 hypothetical protein CPT_Stahl80 [Bacillus phage Stahl]
MIKNKDVTDLFIKTFEHGQPFTPSEKRRMGIMLAQLRKTVNKYLEENNIETDLSTNEIIINTIKYSQMTGKRFRSIGSLGYDVLPESLKYWKGRAVAEEIKAHEKESSNDLDIYSPKQKENVENNGLNGYNKDKKKKLNWLDTEEW